MEPRTTSSKRPSRRVAAWVSSAVGAALVAAAVVLLVTGPGEPASGRAAITRGGAAVSDSALTAALREPATVGSIARTAAVPRAGLAAALSAQRARDAVVVRYRADRPRTELRSVTVLAARRMTDVITAAALSDARHRLTVDRRAADRATAAVLMHAATTGVPDPDAALAEADATLADLRGRRDAAVASKSETATALEEQVASAQQRRFELQAVQTRRVALLRAQARAAAAVDAADAARRILSARVGAATTVEPTVVLGAGSSGPPAWAIALAVVLLVVGAAAIAAGAVAIVRDRNRRAAPVRAAAAAPSPPPAPSAPDAPDAPERTTGPGTGPADPTETPDGNAQLALDELRRRLHVLEARADDGGDRGEDPKVGRPG